MAGFAERKISGNSSGQVNRFNDSRKVAQISTSKSKKVATFLSALKVLHASVSKDSEQTMNITAEIEQFGKEKGRKTKQKHGLSQAGHELRLLYKQFNKDKSENVQFTKDLMNGVIDSLENLQDSNKLQSADFEYLEEKLGDNYDDFLSDLMKCALQKNAFNILQSIKDQYGDPIIGLLLDKCESKEEFKNLCNKFGEENIRAYLYDGIDVENMGNGEIKDFFDKVNTDVDARNMKDSVNVHWMDLNYNVNLLEFLGEDGLRELGIDEESIESAKSNMEIKVLTDSEKPSSSPRINRPLSPQERKSLSPNQLRARLLSSILVPDDESVQATFEELNCRIDDINETLNSKNLKTLLESKASLGNVRSGKIARNEFLKEFLRVKNQQNFCFRVDGNSVYLNAEEDAEGNLNLSSDSFDTVLEQADAKVSDDGSNLISSWLTKAFEPDSDPFIRNFLGVTILADLTLTINDIENLPEDLQKLSKEVGLPIFDFFSDPGSTNFEIVGTNNNGNFTLEKLMLKGCGLKPNVMALMTIFGINPHEHDHLNQSKEYDLIYDITTGSCNLVSSVPDYASSVSTVSPPGSPVSFSTRSSSDSESSKLEKK
ncbi:hypothetical protein DID75_01620 [Candidatus Marinamargulisbacteria bacterium SCGC AG-410-N11]|nr:hypothetical protein DID75_01620 [Candidatus Marinamargulisbacteria bacterium SCGC AG-410-N11]